ncbi:MAG TPA: hypothetical protein PKD51_12570 [Saprospiraceae bacterium]|nr:hypothetical protein [Saprospiraceae bacterium]
MHQIDLNNSISKYDIQLLYKIADLEAHISSLNVELEQFKQHKKISPNDYIFVFVNKCNKKNMASRHYNG